MFLKVSFCVNNPSWLSLRSMLIIISSQSQPINREDGALSHILMQTTTTHQYYSFLCSSLISPCIFFFPFLFNVQFLVYVSYNYISYATDEDCCIAVETFGK